MLGAGREILARVSIRDEWDLVVARRRTRELGSRHGLSPSAAEALATAVTEIARNIVVHAGSGEILFGAGDGPEGGVIVTASDTGPGMRIDEAMQDGFSTRGASGWAFLGHALSSTTSSSSRASARARRSLCANGHPSGRPSRTRL